MHEDQIHAAARAALAEAEHSVDLDAAWTTLMARAEQTTTHRPRRWPMLTIGAAALAAVTIGFLATRPQDVVRTTPTATTPGATAAPPRPATTAVPPADSTTAATSTAAPAAGTTMPATSTAPTTTGPPADPFGAALSAVATSAGLLLGQPDGTWAATDVTEPLTGPAYLVDRYVVQQNGDPSQATTHGRILIAAPERLDIWEPPGTALDATGTPRYRLLDAGLVGGRASMLVAESDLSPPDAADTRLLVVDLGDLTITDLGSFGGWESGVRAAGIGNQGVVVLRSAATSNWVEYVDFQGGAVAQRYDLVADERWSFAVEGDLAWAIRFISREVNTFLGPQTEWYLDVRELDLHSWQTTEREQFAPSLDERPCDWPRYDGRNLTCTSESGPVTSGAAYPAWPDGIVTLRRGARPADAPPYVAGFLPWVDPAVCAPLSRWTRPARTFEWQPFTRRFVSHQIFGSPDLGASAPFAYVGVLVEPDHDLGGAAFEIGPAGTDAWVDLPDGRQAYVRTWGYDAAMIGPLIADLHPRSTDATIPGFDPDAAAAPSHRLIHEQLPGPVTGFSHRLECRQPNIPTGFDDRVVVTANSGDVLYRYLSVLDRTRPVAVAQRGDSVVVIPRYGASDRLPIDQVVAASVADWLALAEIEPPPFMP